MISLRNKDLILIYRYLTHQIDREELSEQLRRTRTNTYYYIGRACHYWIRRDVLRFRKKFKDPKELGGDDV